MSAAPQGVPTGPSADQRITTRHEAMAYSSVPALADDLTARIGTAVEAGSRITAVLDEEAAGQLRSGLGGTAEQVCFLDPREVHSVPGFTTAVRWSRLGRDVGANGGRALVVGQQLLDLPGCGPEYWARLCVGLEVAMVGLPLTVLCPFPDGSANRARTRDSHRLVAGANGATAVNPHYRAPRDVVHEHPPAPRPDLGPPDAELPFHAADLGRLRHLAVELAARGGLTPERVDDVVLTVNELASNSVEHGPGTGRLRLWIDDGLLAEVADHGRLDESFPGMTPPSPFGARGRGLWLASELCDVMEVWSDRGTIIRVSWRR